MSEQLSFLASAPAPKPALKGAEHFSECRARVEADCGGHHEMGPLFAGRPIVRWICCAACPVRGEVASSALPR